jgi:pimeloyl-ACP methyl ester carboxylesterase
MTQPTPKFRSEYLELNDETRQGLPGSFITLPLGVTHYELGGPDNGQPVVLVHGFSVPYYIWDHNFPALVKAGFRVLRFDLFGRGYSDRPPHATYDERLFAEQTLQLLDALAFTGKVDVIGLSMGGAIAAYFTAQHPERVRKLVLIDPAGLPMKKSLLMKLILLPGLGELFMNLYGDHYLVSGQGDDFMHRECFPEFPIQYLPQMKYRGFKASLLSTLRSGMLERQLPSFRMVGEHELPVLLIWGTQDRTVPFPTSQLIIESIPQVDFKPIDGAGHVPHYENADIVNPILIEFLKP